VKFAQESGEGSAPLENACDSMDKRSSFHCSWIGANTEHSLGLEPLGYFISEGLGVEQVAGAENRLLRHVVAQIYLSRCRRRFQRC
jgi:hypothetical protein